MRRQRVRKILLTIALLLFQLKILHLFRSPVVPVFAALAGIVPGSLVVYGALFLSSLFLGRAFCGWFCPGAAMQESLRMVRPHVALPAVLGMARLGRTEGVAAVAGGSAPLASVRIDATDASVRPGHGTGMGWLQWT